jgi:alkaline phosphatase
MTIRTSLSLLLLLATPAVCAAQGQARNVILFLADAAGIPTLHAASLHGHGQARRLFVQRMPHIGLSDTTTASQLVTDSAAGMTAIVTGRRTHNGVLSQGPDAERGVRDGTPLKTILDYAEQHGLSTGIVTDESFTGATPAALYAKVHDRRRTADIFRQAFVARAGDGVDVLVGPGRANVERALAEAGTSLAGIEREHGRPVLASLDVIPAGATRALVLAGEGFDLAAAVARARQMLSANPRGYLLVVESDAHTNVIRRGLDALVAFDRIIEQTATSVGPDTLVLFTADHSFDLRVYSGAVGSPLLDGVEAERSRGLASVRLARVRMDDAHTGEEVLVAAQGPGAEGVKGYLANTDLFGIMMGAFGWKADATR